MRKAKCIMVQGTMSGAGKSLLCAALCRIFAQDGWRVAPFKSQNMALNSFVTKDGAEMGRAQVVQAQAAGVEPDVRMNPILLKPSSDVGSQVIVNGKARGQMSAADYFKMKRTLIPDILEAYNSLAEENDIIVIEGAGSPAEINLKADDIVNMGLAKLVDAPVLLAGDIDRGGVFAQLYGTVELLEPEERARIKGLVINKFRGDVEILRPGLAMLEEKTHLPVVGVVPYLRVEIEDEDSLSDRLDAKRAVKPLDIAILRLPHVSNFTDFIPLEQHELLGVRYVQRARELGAEVLVVEQGEPGFVGRSSTGTNVNRVVLPEDDHEEALRGSVLQTDYMLDQEYAAELIDESYDRFQEILSMGGDYERGWDGGIKWMMMDTDVAGFRQRQAIWIPFGSYKHLNKFVAHARALGAQFRGRTLITELLTHDGVCVGAIGIDVRTGEFLTFQAKAVVVCTADYHAAGCNTSSFTGDGMAMCQRAGAQLRGMEFGRICFGAIWPSYGEQMISASERMAKTFRNSSRKVRIINALGDEEDRYRFCAIGALYTLFYKIDLALRTKEAVQPEPEESIPAKITAFIDQNFYLPIDMDTLCQHVSYSRSYISRIFKSDMGMTVSEYIQLVRIRNAQSLLRDTSLSIQEVSYSVGIDDPLYFSKIFRRLSGQSPRDYRNQARLEKPHS